mmetsp:Transcript_11282/g.35860  ORF Transcript_11282/g.35860 Transcript_11282/m.35860 type:complete len:307 (-) Transcript_11282:898-1818(-)
MPVAEVLGLALPDIRGLRADGRAAVRPEPGHRHVHGQHGTQGLLLRRLEVGRCHERSLRGGCHGALVHQARLWHALRRCAHLWVPPHVLRGVCGPLRRSRLDLLGFSPLGRCCHSTLARSHEHLGVHAGRHDRREDGGALQGGAGARLQLAELVVGCVGLRRLGHLLILGAVGGHPWAQDSVRDHQCVQLGHPDSWASQLAGGQALAARPAQDRHAVVEEERLSRDDGGLHVHHGRGLVRLADHSRQPGGAGHRHGCLWRHSCHRHLHGAEACQPASRQDSHLHILARELAARYRGGHVPVAEELS